MIKKFLLSSICVLLVFINFAQIPAGYYDTATGNGYTLKTQLYNIIKGHNARTYSNLWTDFQSTDKKANGFVWDMYSDIPGGTPAYNFVFVTDQCGTYGTEGDCYNREHSFPKSWFADGTPMYTDLFHLYPTDGKVNGQRSNYPFGEVGSVSWTSTNGSKLGTSDYPGYTGTVFEPIDEYKGDFARTYFYMATRYENVISSWPGSDMLDGSSDQCFSDWTLDMLMDWHNNDPVSIKETDRNNAVYSIQNNRNPFIDHPEFVAKIWGGEIVNNPPAISGIVINPANPRTTDAVNITATITDSDGTISSALLHWGIVSGSLTNTINLSNTSGSTYSTVSPIPAQSDGVTVYYKIEATDDSSDVTITSQYNYTVNNNVYDIIILSEYFTTCPLTGWSTYSIASNKNWTCGSGYESINGYGGDVASNDWLISPMINLNAYHNEIIKFSSWTKYTDTGNHPAVKVKYSLDYSGTGDPSLATWTDLIAIWPNSDSQTWTSSGNIDVSSIIGTQVYFTFQYTSTGTGSSNSTQWELDSILISGDDISTNTIPVINAITTNPTNPVAGQNVTVSANITDSDGTILSAKIKWGNVSGNYPNTINMSASGDVYSGIIPSQSAGTAVYYIIEATDNDNSIKATTQQNYFVSETPNVSPTISDIVVSPAVPLEGQAINISATILDTDGIVSSASIQYGTITGTYTQQISMTKSGDSFSGNIPAQSAGVTIYFIIEAIDDDSDVSTTTENIVTVSAAPNIPPQFDNIELLPSNPEENQQVTLIATISDSDGTISSAIIRWGTVTGSYPNTINMSFGSGKYSGIIPGQSGGTIVYYKLVATDEDNDSTVTNEYNYSVNTPGNTNPVITDLSFNPLTPTSSQSVNVIASITDSDGSIGTAKIKWGTTSGYYPNQVLMTANVNVYSGIILTQPNNTTVYFIIEATDNLGGTTISAEQNYTVSDPVNVIPTISDISFTPTIPTSDQQVSVSAIITDTDGTISTASIKWGTSTGTYPNIILMTNINSSYSGQISAQAEGTRIYFIIEAVDNNSGKQTSTERSYLVTNPANEAPVISDVQYVPVNPTNIDSVLVSVAITDSDGTIFSAVLRWKKGAEPTIYEKTLVLSENRYKAYIPAQEAGKTIYFIIVATDDDNVQASYMDGAYTVIAASGFNEIDLTQVKIYPNPANENLTISFHQTVQNVEISIHSLAGNMIFKERFAHVDETITLFLNDTNAGIYILQIKTQKSQLNRKIIFN